MKRRIRRTAAAIMMDSPTHRHTDGRRRLRPYSLLLPRYPRVYSLSLLDIDCNFPPSRIWMYCFSETSTYHAIQKWQKSPQRRLLILRLFQWQRDKEGTAISRLALYPYAPTKASDDLLRDVKSQPQPLDLRFLVPR